MLTFTPEHTEDVTRLQSIVSAQTVALDGRQELINRLIHDSVDLKEAARRLLLAVLCDQSRSRMMPAIDMTEEIEMLRRELER